MRQSVLHALDLGVLGDWEGAKRSLEHVHDPIVPRLLALFTEQQRRERQRAEAYAVARHRLGNSISIAQANIEALADGVLQPTGERLRAIRDALQTSGAMLDDLTAEQREGRPANRGSELLDVSEIIGAQVTLVASVAEEKNVRISRPVQCSGTATFAGDARAVARAIRHVLLSAVRYTPPGGAISVQWMREDAELLLTVSGERFSMLSKLVEAVGEHAYAISEGPAAATLAVTL